MPLPLFAAEANACRVYKIGRVGWDTGSQDTGGVYTGTLRTGRMAPAGWDGLCYFRRIAIHIWHTGAFTVTLTAYVDGVQTTIFDSNGVRQNQTVTISKSAPSSAPAKSTVEMDLTASGEAIELVMAADSDDITGVFLPESVRVAYQPIREGKARGGAESQ